MNTQQIWQAVLGELELSLSKANFTTWFKGTFIAEVDDKIVFIGVPNAFTKSWLEKKYTSDILKALRNITELPIKELNFRVVTNKKDNDSPTDVDLSSLEKSNTPTTSSETSHAPASTYNKVPAQAHGLNPYYTFDSFVVGKNNELARAAALAVAENPGTTYNPLFIYGGAGLGKTHLLQAIGHSLLKRAPQKTKILYITCEKFTNDFINSVSNGKITNFKDLYRSVDILLIDDIQFLAGKEGTQEEFFHTFNALHQNNKQVVLSSDRPPKSIPSLENRLLTRFEWGMIADISQPDYETRMAILEHKINEKKYQLAKEIVHYLANNIASNIRELEGALNRIIAYHQLNNNAPTLDSVKKILSGLTTNLQKKSLTPKDIIMAVANFYDVAINDIVGKCREKKLVIPRQIIMYLLRNEIKSSFPAIGQELGGRDHTTAMYAVSKVQEDYDNDEKIKREIEQIKQRLYNI